MQGPNLSQGMNDPAAGLLDDLRRAAVDVYGDQLLALAVWKPGGGAADAAGDVLYVLVGLGAAPGGRSACLEAFAAVEQAWNAARPTGWAPELIPFFRTPDDLEQGSPVLLDLLDEGQILYDPAGMLRDRLLRLRRRLEELGAHRRRYRGIPYWDLKPDLKPGEEFEV